MVNFASIFLFTSGTYSKYMVVYVESSCEQQQQLAYEVIGFCYNQLMSDNDVNIFVTLEPIPTNYTYGWCQHNHDNNYDIVVDSELSINTLIKTLCHEMVHVKQGAKDELVETYTGKYQRLWKGVECDIYKECSNSPWEVEAYKLEKELFNSFMKGYNNEKKQTVRGII